MKMKSEEAQKIFDAAVEAEDQRDLDRALSLYGEAGDLEPRSSWPRFCIASVYLDQGKWREAIIAARSVGKNFPRHDLCYLIIGRSHRKLSRFRQAERSFRQSLAIRPEPFTWVLLSDVLARLGCDDEAKSALRAALKLDPNYEEAHYNLGCCYVLSGKNARGLKHLRRAVEIDPEYAFAWAELGKVLLKRSLSEAMAALTRSIELDPAYGWSRAFFANALWRQGKLEAATEQYRKLIEIWPNDPLPYWCYGGFLAYNNYDATLAEQHLRRALEIDPRDAQANYELGKHLLRWNRGREGLSFLRKAARRGDGRAQRVLNAALLQKKSKR